MPCLRPGEVKFNLSFDFQEGERKNANYLPISLALKKTCGNHIDRKDLIGINFEMQRKRFRPVQSGITTSEIIINLRCNALL